LAILWLLAEEVEAAALLTVEELAAAGLAVI
jgi:hypothetical protein